MSYSILTESDMRELDVLSSENLGIVSRNSSTYLRNDSKALIVGLGGMGQETVCRLKQALTKSIGELDPRRIQFLVLDTAERELSKRLHEQEIDRSEFITLHTDTLAMMFDDEGQSYMPQEIKNIIPVGFKPNLDGMGANQKRLAGRVSASDPAIFNLISDKLEDCMKSLKNESKETVYVHIIAGIGGGTGSGLIVDIAYLIRDICERNRFNKINIMGNIYLPNIHRKRSDEPLAYRNGYAALKEIDYYMRIAELSEEYETRFPRRHIKSKKNIFERCTLIGGEVNDMDMGDPKEFAVNVCIKNLTSSIMDTKTVINTGDGTVTQVYFSDEFLNNRGSKLPITFGANNVDNRFPKSANYVYCSVGASSLYFPNVPILEYLAGSVYNKMTAALRANCESLNQSEVDEFENSLGIHPKSLMSPLLRRFEDAMDNIFEQKNITKNNLSQVTREIRQAAQREKSNCVHMLADYDTLLEGALSNANRAADEIFENAAKGPYHLVELIQRNSKEGGNIVGLLEKLEGYSKLSENMEKSAREKLDDKEGQLKKCIDLMKSKGSFGNNPFKRTFLDYKQLLTEICTCELEVEVSSTLTKRYYKEIYYNTGVCFEIKRSLQDNHLHFCDIVEHLDGIMERNVNLNRGKVFNVNAADNILGLSDPDFRNIKHRVATDINQELDGYSNARLNQFTSSFLRQVCSEKNNWRLTPNSPSTESSCVNSFREFVRGEFGTYATDSFSDYLNVAYGTSSNADKASLTNKIIEVLLNKASLPYIIWDETTFSRIPELNFNYIILPQNIGAWSAMFQQSIQTIRPGNNSVMYGPDENTLYCYNLYNSLPLWLHARINEYEEAYYKNPDKGVHTNESPQMLPPYAEYPSLFIKEAWPRAGGYYKDAVEEEYWQKLKYAYDLGSDYGMVKRTGTYKLELAEVPPDILPASSINLVIRNKTGGFSIEEHELAPGLAEHVENFIADRSNEAGGLIDETRIYQSLCKAYGAKPFEIKSNHPSSSGLAAENDENALTLLRKQMKLSGRFLSLLAVVEKMKGLIRSENEKRNNIVWRDRYYRFMLYGFISSDAGKWYYLDINTDRKSMFASAAKINADPRPQVRKLVKYMELASFKLFVELRGSERIKQSLEGEVEHLIDLIDKNEYAEFGAADIVSSGRELIKIAERVNTEFSEKIRRGNLTPEENEIVDFYAELAKVSAETITLYG